MFVYICTFCDNCRVYRMFYALSFTSWKYLNLLKRITHLSVPDVAEVRQYYDVFDRHFVYVYGT